MWAEPCASENPVADVSWVKYLEPERNGEELYGIFFVCLFVCL